MPARNRTAARRNEPEAPNTSTAVVPFNARERSDKLVVALEQRRDQIIAFLGSDPEYAQRFMSVALDAIVRDPNLLSADLASLVNSVRHAAIMGLEPTGIMGEGAIVVYRDSDQGGKKIAQFQPMYRGLAKLARNSGQVAALGVDVVHEKDRFEYRSGSAPEIVHEPFIEGDPGSMIGAYAYARLASGELVPLYMRTAEIFKRRQVSKSWQASGERSVWGSWPEEMAKKTVLRRLMTEKLPASPRAVLALALDAENDSADGDPAKVERQLPGRTALRLVADLGDADEKAAEPAQNGPQAADEVEGESKPVDEQKAAPEPSAEPVCGKPGLKEGQLCTKPKSHAGPHGDGTDEWL
jgi:recombination protein RecT